jgi:hypothetical protein
LDDDRFATLARGAGALVVLLGSSVLLGWILDIAVLKSAIPGAVTMKGNTALSFVLAGLSLLLQVTPGRGQWRGRVGRACALLAAAIGVLTLAEYVVDVDVGIDQLLVRAPDGEVGTSSPGRMAPNTATSFVLAGAALVLQDSGTRAFRSTAQVLTITVLLAGFVAITGYVFSTTALYGVAGYTSMAVHTAVGFVVLSSGTLLSRPRRGVVAILAQENQAGAAGRRR